MAGRIPQQFIDELLNRADIVDVIDARVALKKKGKEYVACCPFHSEKSPSFTVSQQKQFYHCFGCGAHGTALGFIMEYDRLDFVDAVEALAAEYHLDVPREGGGPPPRQQDNKQQLYDILAKANQLYALQLKQSQRAIDYLKQRGLSGEVAKAFSLGYVPEGWDFIYKQLGTSTESIQALNKAGLLIEKDGGKQYDRFRDRIMFPIRDRRGRIIGFGGRILDQGEPKYLNSPETPVFHKGQELYGIFEARQAVRDLQRIVIVEGYMDVVALAQHGIPYAVATLGTATSQEQISRLFRIVPELIFCFDGDQAGRKAAWRALENALPVLRDGVQARFLFLPEGEDPDSLVRHEGQQAFEQRLSQATPLSDFMLEQLAEQVDMTSPDGRARLFEMARPLIGRLQDGVFRDLMLQQLEQRVGMAKSVLEQHIPALEQPTHQAVRQRADHPHQIKITPQRQAIALLLQYPQLAETTRIPEALQQADLPGIPLLLQLHRVILDSGSRSPSALLERWRDTPEQDILNKLIQLEIADSEKPEQCQVLFNDALRQLLRQHRDRRHDQLLEKSRQQPLSDEEKQELKALLQRD